MQHSGSDDDGSRGNLTNARTTTLLLFRYQQWRTSLARVDPHRYLLSSDSCEVQRAVTTDERTTCISAESRRNGATALRYMCRRPAGFPYCRLSLLQARAQQMTLHVVRRLRRCERLAWSMAVAPHGYIGRKVEGHQSAWLVYTELVRLPTATQSTEHILIGAHGG